MTASTEVPVLVVTGTIGAGKSTVLAEIHALLRGRRCPHACVDLDAIGLSWPERGAFNQVTVRENLRALWTNYQAAGAERLVVAGVIEEPSDLGALREAVPHGRTTVCVLLASEAERLARIRAREIGGDLDWHLHRTTELDAVITRAALHDFAVVNEQRAVAEVALEVLVRAGWVSGGGAPDTTPPAPPLPHYHHQRR